MDFRSCIFSANCIQSRISTFSTSKPLSLATICHLDSANEVTDIKYLFAAFNALTFFSHLDILTVFTNYIWKCIVMTWRKVFDEEEICTINYILLKNEAFRLRFLYEYKNMSAEIFYSLLFIRFHRIFQNWAI